LVTLSFDEIWEKDFDYQADEELQTIFTDLKKGEETSIEKGGDNTKLSKL